MRIFNEDKTIELTDVNLEKGYLANDTIVNKKVEQMDNEIQMTTFTNEDIQVYIEYKEPLTEEQKEKKLEYYREQLSETDYEAIKYAEGWFTEEEYEPIKKQREELREKIRQLID